MSVTSGAVHIVILGCGRVGALLADQLDTEGHSVAIVDQEARSFRRLSAGFGGLTVTGVGFDRQTLESAGIERAHAFAAVSSGDNTNIIAARTARETYGVEHVVARIYDPRRAEVYQRLGIPTVATVSWTTGQIIRRLLPQGAQGEYRDPTGTVQLLEMSFHERWIGESIEVIEDRIGSRVGFLTRTGRGHIAEPNLVLQSGDQLFVLVGTDRVRAVEAILASPPNEASGS